MNDALAEDFMAPVRAREQRLAELDRAIVEKEKEFAALEGQCAVSRKAMNDLGQQHVDLQMAVNAEKAKLVRIQHANAEAQGAYDETKRKIMKLVG